MCGIAGILHFDSQRRVDRTTLERMTNVLSHRGPDGCGFYMAKNIGLGHRRLAIIDLFTGAQPMISEDEQLVLVFNGEIYNYVELREELKTLGYSFNTSSDTEVILRAYEAWGFECQKKFNGMWAFALWDARERHLFLSRDRIGEKPLHFSLRDNSIFFGSEIKSILASGLNFQPANNLWHVYLSLGYVPAPYTFFKGISKLMPGHYLVVKDGRATEGTYWDLPQIEEGEMRTDSRRIYDEFTSRFTDSVRIRMRSDVPFGAFLSGGLDSASVVASMAQASQSPVETFTIGFAEKSFDERGLAREVAKRFQTHHHEQVVLPESFDESLNKVLAHFDEPFGDASAVPVGVVSQLARQRVTMALTGDGGDEVLSGYTSYVTEKFAGQFCKVPASLKHALYYSANLACLLSINGARCRMNRWNRLLHLSGASFNDRFISKLSLLDRDSIRKLIPKDVPQLSIEDYVADVFKKCAFTDPFYRLMYFHLKVFLPDDMLAKVDRMSMAHSLETRVPFLDHHLVELAYSVHKNVKMPRYKRKNLLKQTFGAQLPSSLVGAPKKSLKLPFREWFKQKEFENRLADLQRSDYGLNREVVKEVVCAHKNGTGECGDFIWRLFILKRWLSR
jgi:asparagine synthase (glutamine-hydrolysing)